MTKTPNGANTMAKRCAGCGKETDLVMGFSPILLCRECYLDANIDRETVQSAGKSFNVILWARRRYNRLHDTTRTERANRRNDRLNAKAKEIGFDSLSQMLTAWKNGKIRITIEHIILSEKLHEENTIAL